MTLGRITALVIGCLLLLPSVGLVLAGGGLFMAGVVQDQDGYVDMTLDRLSTEGSAITAEGILLVVEPDSPDWVLRALAVDTRLSVGNAAGESPIFVGIAPEDDVDGFLQGVAHTEIRAIDGARPVVVEQPGGTTATVPTDEDFWTVSASGSGTQTVDWQLAGGQWAAVVMNADGSPGLAADVDVGVRVGFLMPLAGMLILVGVVLTVAGVALIIVGAQGAMAQQADTDPDADPSQRGGPTGVAGPGMEDANVPPHPVAAASGSSFHPLTLEARLDPELSRGLWLVKWFLAIPHYIVLWALWLAFMVTTVIAGISILFTGVYPRSIFDFNVGVLRWSWRVSYYATSGGLGTDRYPPFSLDDDPTYPARLDVAYSERLSRGLVLVKWWLLLIPHYIIVGLLVGGSWQWLSSDDTGLRFDITTGGGILGVLVLIAGLALLFTGRYPRQLFDVIVGFNRWVYRVGVYAALMTDEYPPFRLDQGGSEDDHHPVWQPPNPPPSFPGTYPEGAVRHDVPI